MSVSAAIATILQVYNIPPHSEVETDTGVRSAFQVLEGYVLKAIEEIEEGQD